MIIDPTIFETGKVYGYARVSTDQQRLRSQIDALNSVPCDRIFTDKISGSKSARQGLDALIDSLEQNDTAVVYRLDRLGRSVLHLAQILEHFQSNNIGFVSLCEGINTHSAGGKLVWNMMAALGEFQRTLIVENTISGLEAARRAGKTLGRPRLMNEDQIALARQMMEEKRYTNTEIAAKFGVSRMTLHRAMNDWVA